MSTITVNDMTQLALLGKNMKEVAKKYESGIANAYKKFELKVSGNEGVAIAEFVNKLNQIQKVVFNDYPSYLDDFGSVMVNYEALLNGLGFEKEVWSKDGGEGAEGVKNKLIVEQKNKIEAIQKKLDSYFATAATILSQAKISVLSECQDAAKELEQSGSTRVQTDEIIQGYFVQFLDGLKTVKANLEAIQAALNHARYLGELDPSAVVKAIAEKRITTVEQLKAIDAISDAGDGKIVEALYSPNPYKNLGEVNATHVSENMMTIAYSFLYEEVERIQEGKTDFSNLKTFLDALQAQNSSDVATYTEKLIKGGDRYGLSLIAQAFDSKPEFPLNGSVKDYEKYKEELLKSEPELANIRHKLFLANSLTGLFEGMNVYQLGTNRIPQSMGESVIANVIDTKSLNLTAQGLTFKLVRHQVGSDGQVNVNSYDKEFSVSGDQYTERLRQLNERRNKAGLEFLSNVMKMSASAAAGPYGPMAAMGITVLSDIFTYKDEVSDYVDAARNNKDYFSGKMAKPAGVTLDALHAVSKYFETSNELVKKIDESKEGVKNKLFDIGGRSVYHAVGGHYEYKSTSFTPQYDLQAALQIHDMDRSGLKAPAFHKALEEGQSITDALRSMQDSQSALMDMPTDDGIFTDDVKNYLLGNGDITVDKVGADQVWKGLDKLSNNKKLIDSQGEQYTREQLVSDYINVYQNISEGGFLSNEIPKGPQLSN